MRPVSGMAAAGENMQQQKTRTKQSSAAANFDQRAENARDRRVIVKFTRLCTTPIKTASLQEPSS
jgi:hypothetical protein